VVLEKDVLEVEKLKNLINLRRIKFLEEREESKLVSG
jgi:hypothetical protein